MTQFRISLLLYMYAAVLAENVYSVNEKGAFMMQFFLHFILIFFP